jgi:hypothetical protein
MGIRLSETSKHLDALYAIRWEFQAKFSGLQF